LIIVIHFFLPTVTQLKLLAIFSKKDKSIVQDNRSCRAPKINTQLFNICSRGLLQPLLIVYNKGKLIKRKKIRYRINIYLCKRYQLPNNIGL